MGRAMEIESYPGMLACVIAGSGVALMSESMLVGANLNAWLDQQQLVYPATPSQAQAIA